MDASEIIALTIVGAAFLIALRSVFRSALAEPLARWLLKRGRVGMAMKLRSSAAAHGSGCGTCSSGCEPRK